MKTRSVKARRWLLFWTLFIGVGAVAGATGMLVDPSGKAMGMDAMLPYFQALPFSQTLFQNFVFPGVALLIVNGLTNLTAAVFLLKKKRAGVILGGLFGLTLMLWICIQFYMFPLNFMSTAYFLFGLCQALTGYAAWVFGKQEAFSVDPDDYSRIGSHPERLVVFFSRMGYTKKTALEEADRTGAEVYEIRAAEKTDGTAGFWWCGRFGMLRRPMPIEPITVDLSSYEHITICSPIWVFSLSSPIRAFCASARGRIKEADLITVHFKRSRYENALTEAEKLLDLPMTEYRSVTCRFGEIKQP